MRTITRWTSSVVILLSTVFGCGDTDNRLVELSERSMARQAEQNKQMAAQSKEVAKATRQLVEADSQSRQELLKAQADLEGELHKERASVDRQHEALEDERKVLAAQRHQEPIVAAAILQAAGLLACLVPIVLCFFISAHCGANLQARIFEELLILELAEPKLLANKSLPAVSVLPSDQQRPALPDQTNP